MPTHCEYCGGSRVVQLDSRFRSAEFDPAGFAGITAPSTASMERRQFPCPACQPTTGLNFEEISVHVEARDDWWSNVRRAPPGYHDHLIDGLRQRAADKIARRLLGSIGPTVENRPSNRSVVVSMRAVVGVAPVPGPAPRAVEGGVSSAEAAGRYGMLYGGRAGGRAQTATEVMHDRAELRSVRRAESGNPAVTARKLAAEAKRRFDQIYFKGWAVTKEDAVRIMDEACAAVIGGTASAALGEVNLARSAIVGAVDVIESDARREMDRMRLEERQHEFDAARAVRARRAAPPMSETEEVRRRIVEERRAIVRNHAGRMTEADRQTIAEAQPVIIGVDRAASSDRIIRELTEHLDEIATPNEQQRRNEEARRLLDGVAQQVTARMDYSPDVAAHRINVDGTVSAIRALEIYRQQVEEAPNASRSASSNNRAEPRRRR